MSSLATPVVLIAFNRPATTQRVFSAIAAARPARLFLIADGPRLDRPGESEKCAEVRKIMTTIDWPCIVETNFSDINMGCRRRVISGLNWVFERVQEAIILEDDCLPDSTFFLYCAELLERYRERPEIAYISGFNPLEREFSLPWSYYFSHLASIWGWATWRRAWQTYDENLHTWPQVRENGLLECVFPHSRIARYWTSVFDKMYAGNGPNTWDYQWSYTCWMHNWLGVIPARNLVQNIGVGDGATHTLEMDPAMMLAARQLEQPLHHPPVVTAWPEFETHMQERFFAQSLSVRIRRRLEKWISQMRRG